ncbi:hypothetical protein [Pseudomonas sp. efr-133-TYG-103a]|uniref:hypothetical protein n=1 Tax=Pseudomonas sp. efr-133-TYG-103a TaxID=3040308 RepID=UPI0025539591|nr:hypothetical protein [Pseudomonas sp. efr-133-TYG-103a]
MLKVPNILVSTIDDFIQWSGETADENIERATTLKQLIASSNISNKENFSIEENKTFIQYILLCLAYGQLDPGTYQNPSFKVIVSDKVNRIISNIGLKNKGVIFVTSIEEDIIALLNDPKI